jgi:hypothetical protein
LLEAPTAIINQEFEDLPEGIELGAGRIFVRFDSSEQAIEKLLALAMAIGKDLEGFERLTQIVS